jgi:hypothetical protein
MTFFREGHGASIIYWKEETFHYVLHGRDIP